MSVNKVILIGRLGRDPETRYTQGGTAVANFTLATDESFKNRSGERQKKTEWHRIVVWGKQAETVNNYLSKGSQVYIEGRLQTREFETKDGNKRQTTEIVAQNIRFLDTKKREDADPDEGGGEESFDQTESETDEPSF